MDFRVLGSLEVRSGGRLAALGPPKQRAVLAVLLLHAGEIVPTDRLIELLWGERAPRTATHSIQIYVSALRKAIEHDGAGPVIVTRPPGYVLVVEPESIDARRFERLVGEATNALEAGDPSAAADLARMALGLWSGPPLADFTYEEFAQDEIRRLEGCRLDALETLAAAELAGGREQAALEPAAAAIAQDPLRERPRELQMLALYRAGRHPEALRAYQQFRGMLAEELGVDPSPSLQRLQERVLIHDSALAAPTGPEPTPPAMPLRNPYKGLRPFGEDDAGDFFGREALVAELVEALAGGARLLALVGPSGSGKSSVLEAGLLPALRSEGFPGSAGWVIARMMPGPHPMDELAAALRLDTHGVPAGPEPLDAGDARLLRAGQEIVREGGRLLLVIDQFEELFSLGDEPDRQQFLRTLTKAVGDPDGPVAVALAIRADFYDRPLLQPRFAPLFTRGVVNVMPMSADGIEAAIVRPAGRVGVDVEPALLARLVTDMADHAGALPLLQYTLTELFDRSTSRTLTLDAYRELGGLGGALSRRAEELYASLGADRQEVALQLFLRLTRLSEGASHARRRVAVHELTELELDPVALSDVLDAFGRHRLLSFDRDPASGAATVEVAHEALLGEWERLADWIDHHRDDLRQHAALVAAADEWEASGRDPDYLLIGSRLAGYEAWSRDSSLRLTLRERQFLDAGVARRRAEEAEKEAHLDQERRLERRARARLWALLGTITLLAAAATFGVLTWLGSGPPDVVLLFEGTGDRGFGDMAAAGFGSAVAEFDLASDTRLVTSGSREVETELRRLSESGVDLVIVGIGALAEAPARAVAVDHPGTRYVIWEGTEALPGNVTNLGFRSEEGAFLAGAAAALKSETGTIGFIGAFKYPIIDAYLGGYEAGARSVDEDVVVRSAYLTELPDVSGVNSPELGAQAAARLYAQGADVILSVADASSWGVYAAAASGSAPGRQLWAIGVDTDEYESVLAANVADEDDATVWRQHILTSVMKRLDRAFYAVLADYAQGRLEPGPRSFGLADGGVDISRSGGFLVDIDPQLAALRARIISGQIKVPTEPTDTVATPAP